MSSILRNLVGSAGRERNTDVARMCLATARLPCRRVLMTSYFSEEVLLAQRTRIALPHRMYPRSARVKHVALCDHNMPIVATASLMTLQGGSILTWAGQCVIYNSVQCTDQACTHASTCEHAFGVRKRFSPVPYHYLRYTGDLETCHTKRQGAVHVQPRYHYDVQTS